MTEFRNLPAPTRPTASSWNVTVAYLVPLSADAKGVVKHPKNRSIVEYESRCLPTPGQKRSRNLVVEVSLSYLAGRTCFSVGASSRRALNCVGAPDVAHHEFNLEFGGQRTILMPAPNSNVVLKPIYGLGVRGITTLREGEARALSSSQVIAFGEHQRFEFLLVPVYFSARRARQLMIQQERAARRMKVSADTVSVDTVAPVDTIVT